MTEVQFKERIQDAYKAAIEMVAFSNPKGGTILVGVNDKTGAVNGLSYDEIRETSNILASAASDNVEPPVLIQTETVQMGEGVVLAVRIPEGKRKPYRDNKGIIWVKNGSDKRKVFDNSELIDMLVDNGTLSSDELPVEDATMADLDFQTIRQYLLKRFENSFQVQNLSQKDLDGLSIDDLVNKIVPGLTLETLMKNFSLIRQDGKLTVAAILLFGKYPQRWIQTATVKCINFIGTSIAGTEYRDKMHDSEADGNLLVQYNAMMNFLVRNLRKVQTEKDFNSIGTLEIPVETLLEVSVNALLHRSYSRTAPVRLFIFDDRIELHSPGTLPQGLQVQDVMKGISLPRNRVLFANGIYLLPYTGAGTGIIRASYFDHDLRIINDERLQEVVVTIMRPAPVDSVIESNGESNGESIFLTAKEKDILNFCTVPRTSAEIMSHIGITNQTRNRRRLINPLVEKGLLKMLVPDNPNDRNQKYVKKQHKI